MSRPQGTWFRQCLRKKSPATPLGIDPETLRLVAQCLTTTLPEAPLIKNIDLNGIFNVMQYWFIAFNFDSFINFYFLDFTLILNGPLRNAYKIQFYCIYFISRHNKFTYLLLRQKYWNTNINFEDIHIGFPTPQSLIRQSNHNPLLLWFGNFPSVPIMYDHLTWKLFYVRFPESLISKLQGSHHFTTLKMTSYIAGKPWDR
jgi:hypothetical protein